MRRLLICRALDNIRATASPIPFPFKSSDCGRENNLTSRVDDTRVTKKDENDNADDVDGANERKEKREKAGKNKDTAHKGTFQTFYPVLLIIITGWKEDDSLEDKSENGRGRTQTIGDERKREIERERERKREIERER